MKYTGPKRKLCRREQINLFGVSKYDVKKWVKIPGMHWANQPRLSEFGKLLRNKQVLKRMFLLSEKQFSTLVTKTSQKYAKNKWLSHDKVLLQFLESRCDSVVLKSWYASTIMQARQMVAHWHFFLNGVRHTIPSTIMKPWDVLTLRSKLHSSPLYTASSQMSVVPSWISIDKKDLKISVLKSPDVDSKTYPVDILKVIEFYARA